MLRLLMTTFDTSSDRVASDVLADDGASPSVSTTLMIIGATVWLQQLLNLLEILALRIISKSDVARGTHVVLTMLWSVLCTHHHHMILPTMQRTRGKNVEYDLTDSHRRGNASRLIGNRCSLNGFYIHAPLATHIPP